MLRWFRQVLDEANAMNGVPWYYDPTLSAAELESEELLRAKYIRQTRFSEINQPLRLERYLVAQLKKYENQSVPSWRLFKEILTRYPELRVPEVEAFLREHGGCSDFLRQKDPDDPADVLEVYFHSKMFAAWNRARLLGYMHESAGRRAIKISIIGDCALCNEYADASYKKQNYADIPELPLHWGCRCSYTRR